MDKIDCTGIAGKYTVGSCSYYPIGVDAGSSVFGVGCGTIEIEPNGHAKLEGFTIPLDPRLSRGPFFVAEGLRQCRGAINYGWGGSWQVDSLHPGWPETASIYLKRETEQISLHGLQKIE